MIKHHPTCCSPPVLVGEGGSESCEDASPPDCRQIVLGLTLVIS